MNDYLARFRESPASFKKSFALLALAWLCHPLFIYSFFYLNEAVAQSTNEIYRMAAISGGLALLLFLIKKWARALVVMGNAFIVIYDIFVLAVSPPHKVLTMLGVGVALFTLAGTYWLFVKDTRVYFAQVNPNTDPPEPTRSPSDPNHHQ